MTKERLERIITNRDSGGAYSDMQTHETQLNHLLDLQSILPNVLDSGAHLASCESFDHLRKPPISSLMSRGCPKKVLLYLAILCACTAQHC